MVVRARGALAGEDALTEALAGARRVLRPGGRCLVIADGKASGLRGMLAKPGSGPSATRLVGLLGAHYRGARVLAEREGLIFAEAVA